MCGSGDAYAVVGQGSPVAWHMQLLGLWAGNPTQCLLQSACRLLMPGSVPGLSPHVGSPQLRFMALQVARFPDIAVFRKHCPTHCRRLKNGLEAEAAQQCDASREGAQAAQLLTAARQGLQTSQRSRSTASPQERAPAAADA